MPDAAPYRLHISRHYGWSVPPRAPHEGWAACTGRSPGSRLWRFPSAFPTPPGQLAQSVISGIVGEARRLQLRGQPRHRIANDPHRVPYSPVGTYAPRGTDTHLSVQVPRNLSSLGYSPFRIQPASCGFGARSDEQRLCVGMQRKARDIDYTAGRATQTAHVHLNSGR